MARRTKPRVVWLPNTNANSLGNFQGSTAQTFVVGTVGGVGDSAVGEIPIVIDGVQDPIGAEDVSLSDIFNSGYRLRRIVGKIFCSVGIDDESASRVLVTVGLIVRRAETLGVSYAFATGDERLINPSDIDNASDPWIWRRAWILNNGASSNVDPFYNTAPPTNIQCGSVSDGPHVDVKTARIVGPEERLFLNASVTILNPATNPELLTNVQFIADLRCLATLSTSVGNRRNASR